MGVSLKPGLCYCIANHRVILLDLGADRYFALPPKQDAAFQAAILNRSAYGMNDTDLAILLRLGVLVKTAPDAPIAPPPRIPMPRRSALDGLARAARPISALTALLALAKAYLRLRFQSFDKIIAHLQERSIRRRKPESVGQSVPVDLISAFIATRRIAPVRDQCLAQSVAFVSYLADRGYRANLVIGVRSAPFEAHAWVQVGDTVLNDRVDTVAPYTPILVV